MTALLRNWAGDKLMVDGKFVTIEQAVAKRDRCLKLLAEMRAKYQVARGQGREPA